MRRDIYHDFVAREEVEDLGPSVMIRRLDALVSRSGAGNVSSSVLCRRHDPMQRVEELSVSFDSSAWTGRHG